ncbi:hypothetical protein [Hyphococcus luteus]|uniref:Uncharacterized protein n=1 Tax=Hyphococcus luteus TaxID=2058213 RepID=A0A2S7K8Q1_9PROT|nr:hypothetical protein [Marinicaulis flavus]PQA88885.1 hypothetical protein CW354_02685 [Marinicaulis flavus]
MGANKARALAETDGVAGGGGAISGLFFFSARKRHENHCPKSTHRIKRLRLPGRGVWRRRGEGDSRARAYE